MEKELKEKIIVLQNYSNVLKKKNNIQKDSMERMVKNNDILIAQNKAKDKTIKKLQEENKMQQKEIDRLKREAEISTKLSINSTTMEIELSNRINKAIDWIMLYFNEDNELLEILKGSDKE